jgi:hypothetical protein
VVERPSRRNWGKFAVSQPGHEAVSHE